MVKFDLLPSPLARLRRSCLGGREVGQNKSIFLYNPTMKQTNLRVGCQSALQPGTMTGRRSETF